MIDAQKEPDVYAQNEKKLDWHLFWTAAGVVLTLAIITIGSYISLVSKISDSKNELSHEISQLNAELIKIQTVLIIKGIAPPELFGKQPEKN
jgi:hypothetical protein